MIGEDLKNWAAHPYQNYPQVTPPPPPRGPAKDKHQNPTNGLNLYVRAHIESEVWPKEETIAINRDWVNNGHAEYRMISMLYPTFFLYNL